MKRLLFIAAIFAILLMHCAPTRVAYHPTDEVNRIAVANFAYRAEQLDVEPQETEFKFNIFTFFALIDVFETLKDTSATYSRPQPVCIDSVYGSIFSALRRDLGLPLVPDALCQRNIRHDLYGLPYDDAKAVAATGKYDATMDIKLVYSYPSKSTSNSSFGGITKTRVESNPQLALKIKMYDKAGDIIWRETIKTKSKTPVIINQKALCGISYKNKFTAPNFQELMDAVLNELVVRNKSTFVPAVAAEPTVAQVVENQKF